ncbi:hypothetical protein ABZU94_10585 [Streptomyces mirabilis]|uniref:hypothetical protein n=1 Tax=Streptomyces sp. NPDC005388 TaxID=3156717 RepID=UPI00339FD37A
MPEAADQAHICRIRSTVDAERKAACLLEWGPVQALLAPSVVLTTACELTAAAAAAETDIALIETFREDFEADDDMLKVVLSKVRTRRPMPGGEVALRIAAVAGANTGQPYVHIGRGSMKGELSPDEARQMALHWAMAAVASQIDVRLRYALGEWDHLTPSEVEQLFTLIQQAGR